MWVHSACWTLSEAITKGRERLPLLRGTSESKVPQLALATFVMESCVSSWSKRSTTSDGDRIIVARPPEKHTTVMLRVHELLSSSFIIAKAHISKLSVSCNRCEILSTLLRGVVTGSLVIVMLMHARQANLTRFVHHLLPLTTLRLPVVLPWTECIVIIRRSQPGV